MKLLWDSQKGILMGLKLLITFSTLFVASTWASDPTKYLLLEDRRSTLHFPKLSEAGKKEILKQSRFVYRDLFVHEDWKTKHYGPSADITSELDRIEKNLPELTELEFHKSMASVFKNLRDIHTTYYFPRPYSCYRNYLPVNFREVVGQNGKPSFVVSKLLEDERALAVLPSPLSLRVGDELILYDDKPIQQVVAELGDNQGANSPAKKRIAVVKLGSRSQLSNLAPEKDSVTAVMRRGDGSLYEVTLPWISMRSATCSKEGDADSGLDLELKENNEFFRKVQKKRKFVKVSTTTSFLSTEETSITWKIISTPQGNFGVIRFEHFDPEERTPVEIVNIVKSLLLTKLAATDGLILDVRDNPGGFIRIGEYLVQLFTPSDVVPLKFMIKANEATKHYFKDTGFRTDFLEEIEKAMLLGKKFTTPIPLNHSYYLNNLGQVYFRPVAVFNNALCYSTCDMFSALMQDFGNGIVIGEDTTTGAGGANSNDLRTLYADLKEKGPFPLLSDNQNISFSFRQTLRSGKSEGKVIEDVGVQSEYVIPPTREDILSESRFQYERISALLKEKLRDRDSYVKTTGQDIDLVIHSSPSLFLSWKNTDRILARQNGEVVDDISLESTNAEGREVLFPKTIFTNYYNVTQLEVYGFFQGKRVWKKNLRIRIVPETKLITASQRIDLQSDVITLNDINGWNHHEGSLRIGDGAKYDQYLDTSASLFVRPKGAFHLSVRAQIKTSKEDVFKIIVIANGKSTELQKSLSGDLELQDYVYDLSQFGGQKIEIQFLFKSSKEGPGDAVSIRNIVLKKL